MLNSTDFSILHTLPNFTFGHYQKLIAAKITISELLKKPWLYQKFLGLSAQTIDFIRDEKYTDYLSKVDSWLKQSSNHHLIHHIDTGFPSQLKQISDPPLSLYAIGDIALLGTLQLAVVGTRHASFYGAEIIHHLIPELTESNLTITSGMALGIDALAHEEALKNNGKTIAILGTGVNICYPPQNRRLYAEIHSKGLVVSEFLLNQAPKRYHFPRRNRLISGLSLGVVVVEAADRSGSLITAMHALEQNREVFAVPGNIFHNESHGCNKLIQMGAKLSSSADDIISEKTLKQTLNNSKLKPFQQSLLLTQEQQLVFDSISSTCTTIDKIIDNTNLTYAKITGILFELEMEALICAVPGGYKRV